MELQNNDAVRNVTRYERFVEVEIVPMYQVGLLMVSTAIDYTEYQQQQ